MALTVRTNLATLRSIGQLNKSQNELTSSLEKISTGLRVNRSADDSAGLAVANRMASDNQSLRQAMRNANDGISLVQTAEGTLTQIGNILVRMRELSVQSSNGTFTSSDRVLIDKEFEELRLDIRAVAFNSNYNGISLLGGGRTGYITLQVGIDDSVTDKIGISLGEIGATLGALGIRAIVVSSVQAANNAMSVLDDAINSISAKRSTLGSTQNRLESALQEASTYSENLSSSQSQIMDLDYATESANMTRFQIMQQAGVAALGQAKAINQSVVSLLG